MSKILVVDDLPLNVEFLEEELVKLGFEIVTASNGEEALHRVADTHPDLVLLDLSMPVMDGLEVLKSLRADPKHGTLPVILLTAKTDLDDLVAGLDTGLTTTSENPSILRRLSQGSGPT